jgi:enoyl-CoA hydratase/carnithine racemase
VTDVDWSDAPERVPGLRVARRGHVALVLFDRPGAGNAFTSAMHAALGDLWPELDDDPDVRAIVLGATGGRWFSTGIDVAEVAASGVIGDDRPVERALRLTPRHVKSWTPLVCAVDGGVIGGGLHFVVDADIVVASERSTFKDTHVNMGFVGAVENIGLALKAGLGTALYLTLAGRGVGIDARRARELGLVQEVVPDGTALSRALELAEMIAEASPSAVQRSLEAVWSSATLGYEEAVRYGWLLLRRQWDHPDAAEGPRAFAERRAPEWQP